MAILDKKFELASPWPPAGDQPKAISGLVKSLKSGYKHQTLLGVTGSGKTMTMASITNELQRPTLVICHNKTLAAQLASEFQQFFPENAVHYFVSYYDYYQPEAYIPRSDTFIEKETQINEEIDRLRNAATQSLLSRRDVLIVASVSCIYGLGNPGDYMDLSIELSVGNSFKRDKLIRRLTDLQFGRNDFELRRGTFRIQGDTLEINLSSEDTVIRIGFFGDEIESIERRDLLTGDTLEEMNTVTVFPAKHFVATEDKIHEAINNIRNELIEQLAVLRGQGKILEAARLEQRTNFDLEMLTNTGFVAGIENYSRHIDGRAAGEAPSTLIDYFPDDFLMFVDESHQTIPQINGMYNGDRARKMNLVDYGFRLPSAMDNRPLQFAEFEKKVGQVVYVSATPALYEITKSINDNELVGKKSKNKKDARVQVTGGETVVEQIIRPTGLIDPTIEIKPIEHQVDDLLEQIRARVAKHERVLVTTLTKKMSEELTEYLKEANVKVQYLHSEVETFDRLEILRDLRLGVFDVVVGINLLREGLDLPEVSLVAILDADKEGFLRSETAFMQIIGRAARHINGHVIMYADRTTKSMAAAIGETGRRRKIQQDYNTKHGITPTTIVKKIQESRLAGSKVEYDKEADPDNKPVDVARMDPREFKFYTEELKDQMEMAAKNLEFELAAKLRDRLSDIKKMRKMGK